MKASRERMLPPVHRWLALADGVPAAPNGSAREVSEAEAAPGVAPAGGGEGVPGVDPSPPPPAALREEQESEELESRKGESEVQEGAKEASQGVPGAGLVAALPSPDRELRGLWEGVTAEEQEWLMELPHDFQRGPGAVTDPASSQPATSQPAPSQPAPSQPASSQADALPAASGDESLQLVGDTHRLIHRCAGWYSKWYASW